MNLTVYCGANRGNDRAFSAAAAELGSWMAAKGIGLIYGGGRTGLMGVCADAALAGGGKATGVIPSFLKTREQAHTGLTEMITVETMTERKMKMIALGDAFLALPGGPGTLEEIAEAYSLRRLGRHGKPCMVWNVNGCYDALARYFLDMERNGFLCGEDRQALHFIHTLAEAEEILREAGWPL